MLSHGQSYTFLSHFRVGESFDTGTRTTFNMSGESLQVGETFEDGSANKKVYQGKRQCSMEYNADVWNMGSADEGGSDGCNFMYNCVSTRAPYNYWRGELNWYNSMISKWQGSYGDGSMGYGKKTFKNCIFSPFHTLFMITNAVGSSFTNCIIEPTGTAWYIYTDRFSFDNIILTNTPGILAQGCTLSNTAFGSKYLSCYSKVNNLIDCSMDDPASTISNRSARPSSSGYVKYNINIDAYDKDNNATTGSLVITNNQDVEIYNGDTSIEFLSTTYSGTWVDSVETKTDHNPFTFTITKDGYDDYSLTVPVTSAINWKVSLIETAYIYYHQNVEGSINQTQIDGEVIINSIEGTVTATQETTGEVKVI